MTETPDDASAPTSPYPPGTVPAPMNPVPGVAPTVVWEKGTRPDGEIVAVTHWMLGAATFRIEIEERMAEVLIAGLRDIFNKPTLQIARDLPNGVGPLRPFPS